MNQQIEIWADRKAMRRKVDAVQFDSGRVLECIVQDMTVPAGSTARFLAQKPSGMLIYNVAEVSGNTVTVALTNQALAESGIVNCQIELLDTSEKRITSFEFDIDVQRSLVSDNAIESTDEMNAIKEYVEDARQSKEAAAKSEAAAKQSENDAEAAADRAGKSETAAGQSASKAETAMQSAEQSASAAKQSAANLDTARSEAASSAMAAADSAARAKASEDVVKQNAQAAQAAEQNAKSYSDTATQEASKAEGFATSADASATEAETWAGKSQSWAVGTGDPSRADQETDNSKYYAGQAETAQQTANSLASAAASQAGAASEARAGAEASAKEAKDAQAAAESAKAQAEVSAQAAQSVADKLEEVAGGNVLTSEEADAKYVPQTRTVNGKPLSADVTLAASDVSALPSDTVIVVHNHWDISVAATDWTTTSESWAGMTATFKAEKECSGMTAETDITGIQFTGGDRNAAATWSYLRPDAGKVTLFSSEKPTAEFTLRLTEVK